ncbi:MAG: hypothetical protein LBP19_06790 [Treponema sp.]|nr:hypothetical protein [Treponema sp.]
MNNIVHVSKASLISISYMVAGELASVWYRYNFVYHALSRLRIELGSGNEAGEVYGDWHHSILSLYVPIVFTFSSYCVDRYRICALRLAIDVPLKKRYIPVHETPTF